MDCLANNLPFSFVLPVSVPKGYLSLDNCVFDVKSSAVDVCQMDVADDLELKAVTSIPLDNQPGVSKDAVKHFSHVRKHSRDEPKRKRKTKSLGSSISDNEVPEDGGSPSPSLEAVLNAPAKYGVSDESDEGIDPNYVEGLLNGEDEDTSLPCRESTNPSSDAEGYWESISSVFRGGLKVISDTITKALTDLAANSISNAVTEWLKTNIPTVVDRLLDVLSLWGAFTYGGYAQFINLAQVIFRHWFPDWSKMLWKSLSKVAFLDRPEAFDKRGNPVWVFVLGIGLLVAKVMDSSVSSRQIIITAFTVGALYQQSAAITDVFAWIVSIFPKAIQDWMPLCLSGTGNSEVMLKAVAELELYQGMGPVQRLRTDRLQKFAESYKRVIELYKRGDLSASLGSYVNRITRELQVDYDLACAKLGTSNARRPPWWLYLYGAPGIGKSTMVARIIGEISEMGFLEAYRDELSGRINTDLLKWTRPKSNFWDGYQQQPFVVSDDFNSLVEDPIVPETITMVSSEMFIPPMASLDDVGIGKKGTLFTSEFFITTSNSIIVNCNLMNNMDAIYRRRNLVVKVTVDPHVYVNSNVDILKVVELYGKDWGRDLPHLRFHIFNSDSQTEDHAVKKDLKFKDFLTVIYNSVKLHRSFNVAGLTKEQFWVKGKPYMKTVLVHGLEISQGGEGSSEVKDDDKPGDSAQSTSSGDSSDTAKSLLTSIISGNLSPPNRDEPIVSEVTMDDFQFEEMESCETWADVAAQPCRNRRMIFAGQSYFMPCYAACEHCKRCPRCRVWSGFLGRFARQYEEMQKFQIFRQYRPLNTGKVHGDKCECRYCVHMDVIPKELWSHFNPLVHMMRFKKRYFDRASLLQFCEHDRQDTEKICFCCDWQRDKRFLLKAHYSEQGWFQILSCLASAFALTYGGYVLYKAGKALVERFATTTEVVSLIEEAIGDESQSAAYEGSVNPTKASAVRKVAPVTRVKAIDVPQGESVEFQGVIDVSKSIASKMVALLHLKQGSTGYYGGIVLLKGHWAVCPAHYFHMVNRKESLRVELFLSGMTKSFECVLQPKDIFVSEGATKPPYTSDIAFIRFPKQVPEFRNNVHHLVDETKLGVLDLSDCYVQGMNKNLEMERVKVTPKFTSSVSQITGPLDRVWTVDGFQYEGRFVSGSCGSVLVSTASIHGFILGFHRGSYGFPGHNWYGESQLLSRQMVEEFLGEKCVEMPQCLAYPLVEVYPKVVPVDTADYRYLGSLLPKFSVNLSEKSTLAESPLHPIYIGSDVPWSKEAKQPSVLSKKDPRYAREDGLSPLVLAISKFKLPASELPEHFVEAAAEWMFADWTEKKPQWPVRVYTEDEAINGIAGHPYMQRVSMDTSPGWPHVLNRPRGQKGKGFLFTEIGEDQYKISSKALRQDLDDRLRLAKLGVIPEMSLWISCLKSEKRSLAKVEEANTREYTAAPLSHLILSKRYFGAFSEFFHCFRTIGWSSPGINVRSQEWTQEFRYLREVGDRGFDGDFTGFDGVTWFCFILMAGMMINKWYKMYDPSWKAEDDVVRLVLLLEVSQPIHLACNAAFQVFSGCPSGYFLTAVINCCTNYQMSAVAFQMLVAEATYVLWKKNVRCKLYGDDNKFAVSEALIPRFNGQRLAEWYAAYGIRYTPPDKRSQFGEPKRIEELEYLKCKTRILRGSIAVPLMNMDSINEALKWVETNSTAELWDTVAQTVANVMDFLVFYGRALFNEYREAILRVVSSRYNKFIVVPTFTEIMNRLVSNGDFDERLLSTELMDDHDDVKSRESSSGYVPLHFVEVSQSALLKPDEPTGEAVTSVGATIEHAIRPDPLTTHQEPVAPELAMEDVPMEYSVIANKKFNVGSYQWSTAQPDGTIIVDFNTPLDLLQDQQLLQGFQNFKYWRGDVEIEIIVNSTQWHSGLLALTWAPQCSRTAYENFRPVTDKVMISNISLGYIHANTPTPKSVRLPFVAPTNYIDALTANNDDPIGSMGMFSIHVFDALRVSTGTSPSVTISVWVRLVNSSFHLPRGLPLTMALGTKAYNRTLRRFVDQPQMLRLVNGFRGITATAARGAGLVESAAHFVSKVAHITKDGLDKFSNMDRENKMEIGLFTNDKGNAMGNNTIDKTSPFDKLSIVSSELAPTTVAHFSTTHDEMSLDTLLSIPSFLQNVTWSATNAPGTQLYSAVITPCMRLVNETVGTTNLSITYMDFVAAPFRFWRGPIMLHVVMPTTHFVTGALRFAVLFGGTTDAVSVEEADAQYFTILDLKEGEHEYDIKLAWPSDTVMKEVLTAPKAGIVGEPRLNYSTGMLYVHVINQLSVANGSPTTVEVQIFCSAPELQLFGQNINPLVPVAPYTPMAFTPLDEIDFDVVTHDADVTQSRVVELGTKGTMLVSNTPLVRVASVRDISRRLFWYPPVSVAASEGYRFVESTLYKSTGTIASPLAYWASAYASRRGGLRWRVLFNGAVKQLTGFWDPNAANVVPIGGPIDSTLSNTFQSNLANTQAAAMEVESSFTSQYNFVLSPYTYPTSTLADRLNVGSLVYMANATTPYAFSIEYSVGGADDIRFGCLNGPPQMNIVAPF